MIDHPENDPNLRTLEYSVMTANLMCGHHSVVIKLGDFIIEMGHFATSEACEDAASKIAEGLMACIRSAITDRHQLHDMTSAAQAMLDIARETDIPPV